MPAHRGVALVTVMLIVALAATVAAALVSGQQLLIRSTANQLQQRQAWQYARGAELLAAALLEADARLPSNADHPGETWARPQPARPVPGGRIDMVLSALDGRLNVNAVVAGGQLDDVAFARLQRLLVQLRLDPALAWRLVAWIQPTALPASVRLPPAPPRVDDVPAYRGSGRPLADVSELRLLPGLDEAGYRRLLPHVSALPAAAALNVNMAEATVLAALSDRIGAQRARELLHARDLRPHEHIDAFLAHPALRDSAVPRQGLAVASRHFQLVTEVTLAGRRLRIGSTLVREPGGVRVVQRRLLPASIPENEQ